MRATRSDWSSTYTLVPQSVSDEDEGVYEESPESSSQHHTELISVEQTSFLHSCPSPNNHELKSFVSNDNVDLHFPTIHHDSQSMSPSRKCCFVASLFACVAYVVALLWLIPCNLMPCTHRDINQTSPIVIKEWNITLSIGEMSEPRAVAISSNGESVLIFAFQQNEHNNSAIKSANNVEPTSGIMALSGTNGKELWRQLFYTQVVDIVCNITDVNQDHVFDCVIVGSTGLLAAINASNGHTFWYLHNHDEQPLLVEKVSSPCTIGDLNEDGVEDLLILGKTADYTVQDPNSKDMQLLFVSGNTGEIIGQPVSYPYFQHLLDKESNKLPKPLIMKLKNATKIVFVSRGCNNDTESSDFVSLFDLHSIINQATEDRSSMMNASSEISSVKHQTPYTQLCAYGEVLSVVADTQDSCTRLLIVTSTEQNSLACYEYINSFNLKWRFQRENYKIKEAVAGQLNGKNVVIVILNLTKCEFQTTIIILDINDGSELLILQSNSTNRNLSLLQKGKPKFISNHILIEIVQHEDPVTDSYILALLENKSRGLDLTSLIELQRPTKNGIIKGTSYTVVEDKGFVIIVDKNKSETSIKTISLTTRITSQSQRRFGNMLLHPNPT